MEFCVFTEPQQGADYEELLAFARAAERLGFDGFFRSDHVLAMGDGDGLPGPTDAWTTLAGLARETSRIRLGTLVSPVTFRHPGLLAIQVAQVDRMSGGRVELGLGAGWFEQEHAAYGIPYPPRRFGILEEQLEIITGLWSTPEGGRYDFSGRHYDVIDSPALPKPLQSPVPVIVGGAGVTRTPAIAARFATEFNIGFVGRDAIAEKFAGARAAAEAIDRDPATLRLSAALPTRVGAPVEREDVRLFGSPQQVIDRIGGIRELGADRLYLQIMDTRDLEHLELIATEVLPALR
ncbi:LLM class F420-dependent oxidoreductase [Homoserinibacter sp. YIM 151385]|uniref:LLM class F420-dependent oxidoreductase n=1 Tax=Homoserinibacter sp. YIM 151385 TaxID=2985506 RepID=UPI0022F0B6AA|nr:LLM class F420-dependent oxidoreductase [Homoserinibacter sp. YIM 151385]WBU37146.1 LLM class F420-dependent oxidoreductase [Homoserinibacter sp. YIM 151385]